MLGHMSGRRRERISATVPAVRVLSTPAGDVELRIPKVREGAFFPSLLEPRRRVDRALWAVIMTAYVTGTSTRKVDDLVRALGVESGISKSTVSRICEQLDEEVAAFRDRSLDHIEFPYVFVDATYLQRPQQPPGRVPGRRGRHRGRCRRQPAKSSTSTSATPKTRCSGPSSCVASDSAACPGCVLVISDAHTGLTRPRSARRSRERRGNAAGCISCATSSPEVPKAHAEMVAATIRTIFAQPDPASTTDQLRLVADMLRERHPAVSDLLLEAEADVTAYAGVPAPALEEDLVHQPARTTHARNQEDAPTWSGSSPTTPRSSASSDRSFPNNTTNGKSPTAATSAKNPWRSSQPCNQHDTGKEVNQHQLPAAG